MTYVQLSATDVARGASFSLADSTHLHEGRVEGSGWEETEC